MRLKKSSTEEFCIPGRWEILMGSIWPALYNLTHHHYFPIADFPRAPVSSSWWRRAAVTWEELQRQQPEVRYHWGTAAQGTSEISSGFSLQAPASNWNHWHGGHRRIRAPHPKSTCCNTGRRHSSSTGMAAEIKHLLHPLFLSGTAGALFEELQRPGLLPPLTLQITDDKRAQCSTAHVTDFPQQIKALSTPHRLDPSSHQQRETASSSVLSLITKAVQTYTLDVERSYPGAWEN